MQAVVVRLRPVTEADEPLLRAIYADTRADELARTGWSAAACDAFLRLQFDAQRRHYEAAWPAARHSVIEAVGGAQVQPAGRLWIDRRADAIHVLDIALLARWQRRGIGRRCLRRLAEEAQAASIPLQIAVELDNPARRLYDRLGFRPVGEPQGLHQRMAWQARSERLLEESCDEQA